MTQAARATLTPDLVGIPLAPIESSWTSLDCVLYALAIGAGQADSSCELEYTTDNTADHPQKVYPTFGVLSGARCGIIGLLSLLGDAVDVSQMLHGSQRTEQVRPLPTAATVVTRGRVTAAWDKQTATVVETQTETSDMATGEVYCRSTQSLFFRGVGGWGGERGPSAHRPLLAAPPIASSP